MPPRDVESDAQKTPQRTVLRPEDDTEEDGFINCRCVNVVSELMARADLVKQRLGQRQVSSHAEVAVICYLTKA